MGVAGDVFQLIDHQQMDGQSVENVYFYRQDGIFAGNAAEGLVASWIDQILPGITGFQADNVVHVEISAKNLFNEAESHSELISTPGDDTGGQALPIFNAVGYRLVGDNSAVRDGSKRYAGLTEGAQTDGVIDSGTVLTTLAALALLLVDPLAVGLDLDFFFPVVVKRLLVGSSYELPTNAGDAVLSTIIDALFNVEVTSQTSRKIGVGA